MRHRLAAVAAITAFALACSSDSGPIGPGYQHTITPSV